jgi:hypothetical protein
MEVEELIVVSNIFFNQPPPQPIVSQDNPMSEATMLRNTLLKAGLALLEGKILTSLSLTLLIDTTVGTLIFKDELREERLAEAT